MKIAILFICCIAVFVSCKKTQDKACYGIVSPINGPTNISPVHPSFSWLNCSTQPAIFVLSAHRDYSIPIMNTDIFTTSTRADTVLYPFTKYYWIISVKGQDQSYLDSFTTGGVSNIIAGRYLGTGRNNNYAFIGDTTYPYALTVVDAGNDQVALQLPGIDSVTFSKISTTDTTVVYTCKPCSGKYNGFKNLVYDVRNESVTIIYQTGGANFDEWDFTGYGPVY